MVAVEERRLVDAAGDLPREHRPPGEEEEELGLERRALPVPSALGQFPLAQRGQGGLRFMLTYVPEDPNSSYGQLLVDVDDPAAITARVEALGGRVYLEARDRPLGGEQGGAGEG